MLRRDDVEKRGLEAEAGENSRMRPIVEVEGVVHAVLWMYEYVLQIRAHIVVGEAELLVGRGEGQGRANEGKVGVGARALKICEQI